MLPNQSFIFPGSYLRVPGLRTESQWLEIPEIFILRVHIYSSKWLPLLLCLLVRFNNTLWELSPRLCPPRLCVRQITGIVFFRFLLVRDVILLSESRVCVMRVCVSLCVLSHFGPKRKENTYKLKVKVTPFDTGACWYVNFEDAFPLLKHNCPCWFCSSCWCLT